MTTLPDDVVPYRRTREFTASTVPGGLLESHRTKAGTWARIVVLEGTLTYRVLAPRVLAFDLVPGRDGVVEPTVPHQVEPGPDARFYVEFYRRT